MVSHVDRGSVLFRSMSRTAVFVWIQFCSDPAWLGMPSHMLKTSSFARAWRWILSGEGLLLFYQLGCLSGAGGFPRQPSIKVLHETLPSTFHLSIFAVFTQVTVFWDLERKKKNCRFQGSFFIPPLLIVTWRVLSSVSWLLWVDANMAMLKGPA